LMSRRARSSNSRNFQRSVTPPEVLPERSTGAVAELACRKPGVPPLVPAAVVRLKSVRAQGLCYLGFPKIAESGTSNTESEKVMVTSAPRVSVVMASTGGVRMTPSARSSPRRSTGSS
jgi:hypothetical protein